MTQPLLCTACGSIGYSKRRMKGSILTEFLLWCFFLIPGLIYSIWRHSTVAQVCPSCGSSAVIPTDSPIAQQTLKSRGLSGDQIGALAKRKQTSAGRIAGYAFLGLLLFGVIGALLSNNSLTPTPVAPALTAAQDTVSRKAKTDADAKTMWLAAELSLLKSGMKNPAAFSPTSVFLTSDGRGCVKYSSTNSYGATLQGWAVFDKSGTIWSGDAAESRWNRECAGKRGTEQWTEALGGHLVEVSATAVTPTPASVQDPTTATQGGEPAKLISQCGKPDKDFIRNEGGQPIRHVIYRKQNVELMYSREGVPAWLLVGIVEANGDDSMETAEANRRLACAAGSIHTVLDRP